MSVHRHLILIRHTKSSWDDLSVDDFDRPIKKSRIEDAKNMAAKLKELEPEPELIICSPAKRTRQTAAYFCDELEYDPDKIQYEQRIYESSAREILQVVNEIKAGVKRVILVGHNPSLTDFANFYVEEKIMEVPTTGVVWLVFDSPDWEINRETPAKLKYFLAPKEI